MAKRNANSADRILDLARTRGSVTNRDAVQRLRISRQAVHRHLDDLVAQGLLRAEGAGRAVRYLPTDQTWSKQYALRGLAEDAVWREMDATALVRELGAHAREILSYATTEIVNNAIDHSAGKKVEVRLELRGGVARLAVQDDGVGAFAHLRKQLGLATEADAIAEVSKGRVTTAPDRHSGEGLFFVSKAADAFRLEANGHAWIVDNRRDDYAIGPSTIRVGTRASVEIAANTTQTLRALFDAFTEDFQFTKTRIVVRLFEHGVEFVSRSEAKRVLAGLEKFREVVLDFRGVRMVGQGFADEVFRVWARAHPGTVLRPENTSDDVEFMIRRATATADR